MNEESDLNEYQIYDPEFESWCYAVEIGINTYNNLNGSDIESRQGLLRDLYDDGMTAEEAISCFVGGRVYDYSV